MKHLYYFDYMNFNILKIKKSFLNLQFLNPS
jgi:hypothetical protein